MKNRQEILAIHGISKTYSEPVLVDVTLALYSGKVLALTGENGAGKSTLAKIIGGLTSATSGQIIYQENLTRLTVGKMLKNWVSAW